MSTLKVDNLQTSAGAPMYAAKAWVNFNGTGTVAIRASGNVSSITDQGTGRYRVNFSTAMPDANYTVSALAEHNVGVWGGFIFIYETDGLNASYVNIQCTSSNYVAQDYGVVPVTVIR